MYLNRLSLSSILSMLLLISFFTRVSIRVSSIPSLTKISQNTADVHDDSPSNCPIVFSLFFRLTDRVARSRRLLSSNPEPRQLRTNRRDKFTLLRPFIRSPSDPIFLAKSTFKVSSCHSDKIRRESHRYVLITVTTF